jgi:hypothetical protein
MPTSILLDITLASPRLLFGLAVTWRVIWPRWKVVGKVAFHTVTGASSSAGSIKAPGLAFHVWFCRKHGFTWYAVEDPERYVARSKEFIGSKGDR